MGPRTLSIVGRGLGFEDAFTERSDVVWTVSSSYLRCIASFFTLQKEDKVFQLHAPECFEGWLHLIEDNLVLMAANNVFPKATVFPKQALVEKYGPKFGGSVPWMLAWAIELGFSEIRFFGVHLFDSTEYGRQRDSFFYFLGRAEAAGIKVVVPKNSGIDLNQVYGG